MRLGTRRVRPKEFHSKARSQYDNLKNDIFHSMTLPMTSQPHQTHRSPLHTTLCSCRCRIHLPSAPPQATATQPPHHQTSQDRSKGPKKQAKGTYPSLCAGSLICNRDESSVIQQTFLCAALGRLLLLLFLDFGSLRLDFTGTGEGAVLFTLHKNG